MRAPTTDLPIVLENVSFRAGALTILDGISLTLGAGEPTVLIGPNGSGKTTLLKMMMGLIAPTSGRLTWGGRESVPPERRALVFQRPVMLRRSVTGNLRYALGRCANADERVADLLALVGLSGFEQRPARRLSGGEQQRLALARALARMPSVLFLDEPAASLDPAAAKSVEDVVRAVAARGVKVVMSTHDLGQARRLTGEIVLMHRGRIVESSPTAEFFSAPRTQAAKTFMAGELLV